MKTTRALTLAVSFLTLWIAAPALAGVVFELETKDHEATPPKSEEMAISAEDHFLKMNISTTGNRQDDEVIFNADRREMVIIDHHRKTYMVMDEEAMEGIAGQVSSAMSQVQEALKNVPEAQRAMVEKMMQERMPKAASKQSTRPQQEVRRTQERANHHGYPCVRYEVLNGDRVVRELWVTDWDNIEGGDEVRKSFTAMADFFSDMLESVGQLAGAAGGTGFVDGMADNMMTVFNEIDGFPVVTKGFEDDGSLADESNLRTAKRQTLDPADFEPPAGYKRQQMFDGGS